MHSSVILIAILGAFVISANKATKLDSGCVEQMPLQEKKEALLDLSRSLARVLDGTPKDAEEKALSRELEEAFIRNPWFTPYQMRTSLSSLAEMLREDSIERWIAPYREVMVDGQKVRSVLLIMAGNIPFVGMQDVLAVLLYGHQALIKPSSKDERSLPRLLDLLRRYKAFEGKIQVLEGPSGTPDAVIATGSDNSTRYFSYYFGHLPHTFRGDRCGAAILNGDEDDQELQALLQDIFLYYGRGCRNVSKLFVPQDWDPTRLLELLDEQEWLKEHQKYMNNVAYHKAIYLMNGERFYEGETLLLKADEAIASPLGVLYYSSYSGKDELEERLQRCSDELQCVIGRDRIPFGKGQFPELGEHEAEKDPLALLAELQDKA